ncbi:MAG: RagB/SusD family nutrient uptake outer membrane protein [Bacteroidota bacterium]
MRYRHTIIATLLLFIAAGCTTDWLDVTPDDSLQESVFYKTQEHAVMAVTSVYELLHSPSLYGRDYFILLDIVSDDCVGENPGMPYDNFTFQNTDERIENIYVHALRGIFRANLAMEKIPGIEMDQQLKKRLIAESKVLRAHFNWILVTTYGKAQLVNRVLLTSELKQAGVEEIMEFYDQIETDLLEAIPDLPDSYNEMNTGRVTSGAAMGLLGKSYIYRASYDENPEENWWQKAAEQFEQLIESGKYSLIQPLTTDSTGYFNAYMAVFTEQPYPNGYGGVSTAQGGENNNESLFEVQFSSHTLWNPWLHWGATTSHRAQVLNSNGFASGWRNMVPTQNFLNEFESPGPDGLDFDIRKYASVWQRGDICDLREEYKELPGLYMVPFEPTTMALHTGYIIKKTVFPIHYDNQNIDFPNNWRVLRYADVLLLYAEALVNGATSSLGATPASLLNQIRARVGMGDVEDLMSGNGWDIRQAIMHERRVEMGFEIQRFLDLVRWSRSGWIDDINRYMPDFTPGRNEVFPIPQREISLNDGLLKQNPGY